MAYIKAPNMSIWEYDSEGELTGEYFTPNYNYQGNGMAYYNPVAVVDQSFNDRQQNRIGYSFVLRYKLLDWLTFNQTVSLAYSGTKSNQFLPRTAVGAHWLDQDNNFAAESNSTNTTNLYRTQFFLRPRMKNRNHSLVAMVMMEPEVLSSESTTIQGDNFASVDLSDPATLGVMRSLRSTSSQIRSIGFLGNINYKFKDKYIFDIKTRMDGSSKFGANNRWGVFPSASFGWRFSEENWMQNLPWLSDSKIRISWGEAGRQPGQAYGRHAIFSPGKTYMNQSVIVATKVQLDNLRWEKKTSLNLGLDLGLLKGKINITVDLYKDKIEDLLWPNYDIPTVSGYTRLSYFNGGQMANKGWEFSTNAMILKKGDLRWSINGNISQNFSVFQEFPDNFVNEVNASLDNGEYPVKANIDQPIGSFYGLNYLGVWPTDESVQATTANGELLSDLEGNPMRLSYGLGEYYFAGGDARYEDINHDGVIDINDVVYLGDSNPEFNGGFGSRISWKNFMISAQLHFRTGFDIVNGVAIQTEGMLNRNNQSRAVLHRWTYQGQDESNMLPRAYMNHPANNLGSSRYVEDGSFLRLNNVSFSYNLPKELCKSMRINGFRIAISMRKLLTFTNYTGQDPEVNQNSSGSPFWFGTDRARTPVPRVYTMSMTLEF
jgi:TonB-linked SusC/RagA family outer membrane protein